MRITGALTATLGAAALAAAPLPAAAQTVHATLEGYQEVPALSTPGAGSFRARIDRRTAAIHWQLSYGDIPSAVLQAHIHFGQHGVNGGIGAFLCSNLGNGPAGTQACPQSGEIGGTITAADVVGPAAQGITPGEFDELIEAVRRGVAYVNVHSAERPGGEIRGQIR
ncbi:MAG: CHRD domain-containing protein [Betaproteobacteria bacterium]|nr:MAG: CHRD domain-containing protein [Betaproteobacteria bacterium]